MKPDASKRNSDPRYLRELLKLADLSQASAATLLDISPRTMRYYLSLSDDHQPAPYCIQFALECLAGINSPSYLSQTSDAA